MARPPVSLVAIALLSACGGAANDPTPTPVEVQPAPAAAPSSAPAAPPTTADGRCTVTVGQNQSSYVYAAGRLQRSESTVGRAVTTFEYEGDRLTRAERRNGDEVSFEQTVRYDETGRAVEIQHRVPPEASELDTPERRTLSYDAAGRLARVLVTSAREEIPAQTTDLEYDARGQVVLWRTDDGSGEPPGRQQMSYDAAGRMTSLDAGDVRWTWERGVSPHRDRATFATSDGTVLSVQELVHDESDRLTETRIVEGGGEGDRREYEGSFPASFECGAVVPVPPGIPTDFDWLGFSP